MTIFKNTSVALTIGLVELTATAREINENTFRTFEAFGVVTIIYLVDRADRLAGDAPDRAGGSAAGCREREGAERMRVDLAALVSAWPFLMKGLWFTLEITLVGVYRRHRFRKPARGRAAVAEPAAVGMLRPPTSI